jgi:hypothetical protein
MAATRRQHETPMTEAEQSFRGTVDAVQILSIVTSTKTPTLCARVHCEKTLMSLVQIAHCQP